MTEPIDVVAVARRVADWCEKHDGKPDAYLFGGRPSVADALALARAVLSLSEVVEAADETLRRVTDWTSQQEEGDKLLDPWELRLKVALDRLRARVEGGT